MSDTATPEPTPATADPVEPTQFVPQDFDADVWTVHQRSEEPGWNVIDRRR